MKDHGQHKQAATPASFRSGLPVIKHRPCGGRVVKNCWNDWECLVCKQGWRRERIDGWGESEIETRFYLDGNVDLTVHVMVWASEGKKQFTKLVPQGEASQYERVVL